MSGLLCIALMLGAAGALQDADAPRSCCYTNRLYAGVCTVELGEGETCSSVLAYLNDSRSQGKTYCESTSIRGGWKQVECPAQEAPPELTHR